jgi:peptidoglycan/LPS O-acetylase OafA/YrhL
LESTRSNYIPTLDGWRAIAILLVLFDHTVFKTFRPYGWTLVGGHGVEIFFVLSGYLITGKLLEDNSLAKFYTRRAFRILPVLFTYLCVVCALGFGLHQIPVLKSEIVSSAFFVRNYLVCPASATAGIGWFTAHLWSLSIEEQFYLLWPLVLLRIGQGTVRRQLLAAMSLFAFWTAVLTMVHVARSFHLFGWPWFPNINYAGLVAGCVLRIAFSDPVFAAAITRVFKGRSIFFVSLLFLYIAVFHRTSTMFDFVFCALGVCATLVDPNAAVGRILELRLLRWIGRLSYSLYIWQQLFLAFGPIFRPLGVFSKFPINLVSILIVSCASYYLLEKPLMRLGHRLTTTNKPQIESMPVVKAVA